MIQWANHYSKIIPELDLLNASMNGVKLTNALAGKRAKELGVVVNSRFIELLKKSSGGINNLEKASGKDK